SGPIVPQPGVTLGCSQHYNHVCKGTFTPFTGQRVAVGSIVASGKPDVAVLSNTDVKKNNAVISALQVGGKKFDTAAGSGRTSVTASLTGLGDFKADALAIGQPGYPDGNGFGAIAVTKTTASGSTAIRLVRFVTPTPPAIAAFQDITSQALPQPGASD